MNPNRRYPASGRSDFDERHYSRWSNAANKPSSYRPQEHYRRPYPRSEFEDEYRRDSDRDYYQKRYDHYGASQNYGSMGSYGGAQGYGSARSGYSNEGWGSGHRGVSSQPYHTVYGAYRDHNSFARGEKPVFDGSQRYGSQGAEAYRRNMRPEAKNWMQSRRIETDHKDDRYEIYDSSVSQYRHGDYGNPTRGTITDHFNQRSHHEFPPGHAYGSRQRAGYRQGSGNDQDAYYGTSDIEYNQSGPPFESERSDEIPNPPSHYYDWFAKGEKSRRSPYDRGDY